ncbi:MAG TPA: hypothetical protein VFG09_14525 [Thermodesulfovibrionales bacterium]|jgi:hypothetical protein|nr:hypothetical protein [Thermodesulfovibrionales bacterium]
MVHWESGREYVCVDALLNEAMKFGRSFIVIFVVADERTKIGIDYLMPPADDEQST